MRRFDSGKSVNKTFENVSCQRSNQKNFSVVFSAKLI